jgi:hypothetical protein
MSLPESIGQLKKKDSVQEVKMSYNQSVLGVPVLSLTHTLGKSKIPSEASLRDVAQA